MSTQNKPMRNYELVLVINPELVDEKFEMIVNNVSKFIIENEGTISDVERWGKRKMAYRIKKFGEGSYVLVRFELKPAATKELVKNLEISEEIFRHLLVNPDN
ncbi:30S ribosomal protein S6 [Chloroflexota bacterium]